MIRFLIFIVLSSLLAACTSCKKNKDEISKHTINGMVFNNCTDSGLAGVTVYLKTYKNNSEIGSSQTTSGINGSFTFSDVDIHSDTKYTYAIYIPSKSGTAATTPEYCRFDGTTMSFTNDEVSSFFQPKVTPGFLFFTLQFKQSMITTNSDSIVVNYFQKYFHSNVANLPYNLYAKCYGGTLTQNGTVANYPMGMWNLKIDKWKNSIHTITYDSIYIGWASTKTYTVSW